MSTGYDFHSAARVEATLDAHAAIRRSVFNYMRHQLGWSAEACEERVLVEAVREIPRRALDGLSGAGWNVSGARVLDVGCGQGGALLELLHRGADAWGVEPGPEFLEVSRLRLREAGFRGTRALRAAGEALPFPDGYFDYVISLQVLEHVEDPEPVLREILRVLRPGGRCFISCENYLSFREQHYRVLWLPLLPKTIGSAYLRMRGRNPDFLKRYVHYSTYPQIWRLCRTLGFRNETYGEYLSKLDRPESIRRAPVRWGVRGLQRISPDLAARSAETLLHAANCLRTGVRVHLRRPELPCP